MRHEGGLEGERGRRENETRGRGGGRGGEEQWKKRGR